MLINTAAQVQEFLLQIPNTLKPTQKKICLPILQRISHKMRLGVQFDPIYVNANLLINGHHRYICSLLVKLSLEQISWAQPSQIVVYNWADVLIDENDWESQEIIERHNTKDSIRSGLNISSLEF